MLIEFLTKRTLPSVTVTLTPPGCQLSTAGQLDTAAFRSHHAMGISHHFARMNRVSAGLSRNIRSCCRDQRRFVRSGTPRERVTFPFVGMVRSRPGLMEVEQGPMQGHRSQPAALFGELSLRLVASPLESRVIHGDRACVGSGHQLALRATGWFAPRLDCACTILPVLIAAEPRTYTSAWLLVSLGLAVCLVPISGDIETRCEPGSLGASRSCLGWFSCSRVSSSPRIGSQAPASQAVRCRRAIRRTSFSSCWTRSEQTV